MPGSTSRWGQHEDPRDNTVDLPRIDVDGLTDYFRRAAPMLEPEPAGLLEPLPEQKPAGLLEPLPEPDPAGLQEPLPEQDPAGLLEPPPEQEPIPPARVAAPPESKTALPAEPASPAAKPARAAANPSERTRAALGRADRAPTGSRADLRFRLAQLPDGHPSSPYEDDGQVRALPLRLRQLELGLPAPTREAVAATAGEVGASDIPLDHARDMTEPADDLAVDAPAEEAPGTPAPRIPVGGTPAPVEPAVESDSEPPRLSGPSLAPPEWADPYATPGNGRIDRTGVGSSPKPDLTLGPWQATPSTRLSGLDGLSHRGRNGHGPNNGHATGARRRDSPPEPDRAERTPADADRRETAAHRTAAEPSADLRELVERTISVGRTAEGRNVFDGYGSSGLTPMMQRIAAHLPFGGLAPGSEANSLKSSERLTAKLARLVARSPGRTAEEMTAAIGDVVRYAFAFEAADYVEGTWLVHRRLKSHGFELEIRRNRWESPECKGIFTQWRDPAHQIPFEVQFHTTASWAVVQQTHEIYVQITDPATPPADRARLRARQIAAAAAAKAPSNWSELGDFRLEAR